MTTITEDGNRQNIYAKEPPMSFDEKYTELHNEKAEKLNIKIISATELTNLISGQNLLFQDKLTIKPIK